MGGGVAVGVDLHQLPSAAWDHRRALAELVDLNQGLIRGGVLPSSGQSQARVRAMFTAIIFFGLSSMFAAIAASVIRPQPVLVPVKVTRRHRR